MGQRGLRTQPEEQMEDKSHSVQSSQETLLLQLSPLGKKSVPNFLTGRGDTSEEQTAC